MGTVGSDIGDRLELHVVGEYAFFGAVWAKSRLHVFQHARFAEEDALAADLQRRIISKQIRQRRPLALVDEITIGALQAFDLVHVFQMGDARIERVQPFGCGLRQHGCRTGKRQNSR